MFSLFRSTSDRHMRVAKDIERVQSVLTSANCKLRQVKNNLDALALRAIQDLRKFPGLVSYPAEHIDLCLIIHRIMSTM